MANERIRKRALERGVRLWEIALKIGIADSNFSRMLRTDLAAEDEQRILKIIDDISAADNGNSRSKRGNI